MHIAKLSEMPFKIYHYDTPIDNNPQDNTGIVSLVEICGTEFITKLLNVYCEIFGTSSYDKAHTSL